MERVGDAGSNSKGWVEGILIVGRIGKEGF